MRASPKTATETQPLATIKQEVTIMVSSMNLYSRYCAVYYFYYYCYYYDILYIYIYMHQSCPVPPMGHGHYIP